MSTGLPGLFACGEAVGGANGANRLSGNAITEALVFGRRAGQSAAVHAATLSEAHDGGDDLQAALDLIAADMPARDLNTAELLQSLQATMQDDVGPLRSAEKLTHALGKIDDLTESIGDLPPGGAGGFDMRRLDWLDLRNMLLVGRVVAEAARARTESRGAQIREDFPETSTDWAVSQRVTWRNGAIALLRSKRETKVAAAS
jgi:succinate dehydrogenase/fumarate reductase flavoprotein subunit